MNLKKRLLLVCALSLVTGSVRAAGWIANDTGVGTYIQAASDDAPKILKRDQGQWGENNLLSLDAKVSFGLWMAGPNPDTYRNRFGTPIYMYKFRLSTNGGEAKPFGPYGFNAKGWAVSSLPKGKGSYRLEMLVVDRDTLAETSIATKEYKIVDGTVGGGENGTGSTGGDFTGGTTDPSKNSQVKAEGTWDIHIGGLTGSANENTSYYHAVLMIKKEATSYSATIKFDDINTTEKLSKISFSEATGELTFIRPPLLGRKNNQNYTAKIGGNKLTGTFSDIGGDGKATSQKWWGASISQ